MDTKCKSIDFEINNCKQRLNTLEQSAQFLSNVSDEYAALKHKLDSITNGIETSNSVNKNFNEKLLDTETQNLEKNLLFFSIAELPVQESDSGKQQKNGTTRGSGEPVSLT